MIVAFTGHRPDKLGGYEIPNPTYLHIYNQIEKALINLKPEKVITGMALGIDQWAAIIAYRLKIPYLSAIPFENQECKWPEDSQKTFRILRKLASEEVIVSEGAYAASKMQVRNEWMVNNCDVLIAIWDGSKGGTGNCIEYAKSIGKKIIYINPRD